MIVVVDALQALECTDCKSLIEMERAVSDDPELRLRWIECVAGQHAACGAAGEEVSQKVRRKKLHRYRPMRGQS
jgi:hypothetical protein